MGFVSSKFMNKILSRELKSKPDFYFKKIYSEFSEVRFEIFKKQFVHTLPEICVIELELKNFKLTLKHLLK